MTRTINLTNGGTTIVDDDDYPLIAHFNWHRRYGYAVRAALRRQGETGNTIYLHRTLVGAVGNQITDHIDGDRLNNTRSNLRLATAQQNAANRRMSGFWNGKKIVSRYKGVTLQKVGGKWQARIGFNRLQIYLGRFKSEESAALAYNEAAVKYFGEFACLNDIPLEH